MKCLFDLIVAVPSVILLTPIFVLIGFFVRMKIGSPILFKQVRPGLHGRPFVIYKFRTMTGERGEDGNLLPDRERLTRLGRFLRMTSIDELPEFFNVVKGDMSIVGPRPLLMQYLDRYTPEQARRHEVRPGITGWAQVNGRNAISWEDKFKLDVWYVDNWSLLLDVKIIVMTVVKVLRRDGISQAGEDTAQEFFGSHAKARRRKW
jgi:lipopolysaccharide/colanic/teichoic acid biosynthesis glycosyltransferase